MDAFDYHSGRSRDEEAPQAPVFAEGLRAFSFLPRVEAASFEVRYHTRAHRPNHRVTVRNALDGWARDLFGVYRDGAWRFSFDRARYAAGLELKFLLDGEWMIGSNLRLMPDRDYDFGENDLGFPAVPARFLHEYDNLYTTETNLQQDRVRRTAREAELYDIIIVGSGMGGGVLADALSDSGKKVLVLEAGSLLYPTHITNLPGDWSALPALHQSGHFINEPGSEFLFGVQMALGGRSTFWSGIIPRMRSWELATWPAPIHGYLTSTGYDEAEQLMRKQRTLGPFQDRLIRELSQRFPQLQVEALPRSRHQPDLDVEGQLGNVLQGSTGVFSTADLLLDSLAYPGASGRDNLNVALNHLVTRVLTDGRRAVGVECQDLLGGVQRIYRGRQIVLAAGSLESPKIALASGLTDPNGKIGRGLTDHPAFFSNIYQIPKGSAFDGGNHHAKLLLGHKQATQSQHPYNVELLLNPKYWDVRLADDDLWRERIETDQHTLVQMKFIFASPLVDGNTVRLRGPGEKLAVKVDRNLSGSDLWPEVRDLRNELLTALGVPVSNQNDSMHYGNEGTVHHAGGTLRMADDASGVVDADLRFLAYDNLYACDVSVFPMIPAANPSLTLAALALRLAKRLAH